MASKDELQINLTPIRDCVIDMYIPVLQDILSHNHTHYIGSGGRGSTKSSFYGGIAIPLLIMANNNVHAICFRKVGNTLQNSVFAQVIWGIYKLGVEGLFKIPKSHSNPIVYLPTGQQILFMGLDDPNKVKSVKLPFGYVAITWFEELDQFSGDAEIRKVLQSTMRGGELFWDFRTFNPPISKLNWANQYAEVVSTKPNTLVTKNTYKDVPIAWIGQQFIEEAEDLKARDERAYTHEYLGVAIGTGGDIFPNVCDLDMSQLVDIGGKSIPMYETFDRIYNGIDWGYAKDPFRFVKCHFDSKRLDLYIYREYNSFRARNEDTFAELYDELKLVDRKEQVIADSAEEKSIADYKAYGAFIRGAEKGNNSRRYSMKWLQGLHHIYIDKRMCPYTYEEFVNYEYEQDKSGNFLSEYPDGNDHSIDACLEEGTLVSTPNGLVPIENLVGTEGNIYAYDIKSGEQVVADYIHCRKTYDDAEIFEIELEDGRVIRCTGNHRILTHNRGYVRADELTDNDDVVCIINDTRRCMKIKSIKKTNKKSKVYDLEVPKYHNFVLGNGVVVHNCRYALNKYWARKGN